MFRDAVARMQKLDRPAGARLRSWDIPEKVAGFISSPKTNMARAGDIGNGSSSPFTRSSHPSFRVSAVVAARVAPEGTRQHRPRNVTGHQPSSPSLHPCAGSQRGDERAAPRQEALRRLPGARERRPWSSRSEDSCSRGQEIVRAKDFHGHNLNRTQPVPTASGISVNMKKKPWRP